MRGAEQLASAVSDLYRVAALRIASVDYIT